MSIEASTSHSSQLPSFSLVLETENLATAGIVALTRCLHSLEDQTLAVSLAKQVILVDSQDAPKARIQELTAAFPWIQVVQVAPQTPYYAAKMAGYEQTTGDVVIFCDSDCQYQQDWLAQLLGVFKTHPDAGIVAGETCIEVDDAFSFAVALIWGFPTFSNQQKPYRANFYAANNVAFKRSVLKDLPIPDELSVYRGNCSVHSIELRKQGFKIYKNDQARTLHPLPAKNFRELFWRFLVNGRDWLIWDRRANRAQTNKNFLFNLAQDGISFIKVSSRWLARPFIKLPRALAQDKNRFVFLPLALLIIIYTECIFILGFILGMLFPDQILKVGSKKLES